MPNAMPRPDEYQRVWQHAALFDRSDRGKLTLTGPDASRFLHNLCTNDILGLPAGAGCEAFLTTNKAKAIAYVLVFHQPDPERLWLDTDPDRADVAFRHLDRYLISERVEIADRTTEYAQFYVAGPQAIEAVSSALGLTSSPDPMHEAAGTDDVWVCRRDFMPGLPGFDVICPAEKGGAIRGLLLEKEPHRPVRRLAKSFASRREYPCSAWTSTRSEWSSRSAAGRGRSATPRGVTSARRRS